MIELVEKTLMTAVGAVTLTQKKGEELLTEMRSKFNVSEEEGRAFLNKLQETAKQNQAKLEEMAQEEVRKALDRVGIVRADEFDKLKKKVSLLEKKLKAAS